MTKAQKQQVRNAVATGAKVNRGGILSEVGGALGSLVGLPGVGKFLGSSIASVLGRGDYAVAGQGIKSNSLVTGTTPPAFGNEKSDRATIISHREYLTDIKSGPTLTNGATDFAYTAYDINPGLSASFPWLAKVAQNFEEYEMLGCLFEFKSTSGNALTSTNTALGTVIQSTQYNVLNEPFASKLTQENYEFAMSLKPSESGLHAVECARNQNVLPRLYIRAGLPPVDSDQRMYDLGQYQISTVGMQAANVVIGELWITYHVALYKPKVPLTVDNPILSGKLYSAAGTASYPLGNVNLNAVAGSTLALQMIWDNPNNKTTILFPQDVTSGYFLCLLRYNMAAGASNTGSQLNVVSNCAITQLCRTPTSNATEISSAFIVRVLGPSANMTVTGQTGSAFGNCFFYATQWNANTPLLINDSIDSKREIDLIISYAKKLAKLHKGGIDLAALFKTEEESDEPDEFGGLFKAEGDKEIATSK